MTMTMPKTMLRGTLLCAVLSTLAACGGTSSNDSSSAQATTSSATGNAGASGPTSMSRSGTTTTSSGTSTSTSSTSGANGGATSALARVFTLATRASANSVAPGQTVTLGASLTAAQAQSNMIVDMEIHDANGNKVAQNYFSGQNFSASQAVPFSWSYQVPATAASGTYTLEVGVFTGDWATESYYNAAAAQFVTTNATTSAPAPTSTSAPTASPSKAALLAYINSLTGKTGKHILVGQHTNYWDSVPTDDLTGLFTQTGKNPAIVGVQIDTNSGPEGVVGGQYNGITLANQYISQGNIVLVTEVPGSPMNGSQMWNQVSLPDSPIPASNFANMTVPGTAEYAAFQTYLAKLSSALKQINGPVLFRPFAEQNGTWFWYGNQNPAQFIKMWQMMWDYVTNTAGLDNIIWVYATNAGMGNYSAYYPGSTYVDIVGEDAYPPTLGDAEVWQELGTLGKPEIYAEFGDKLVSETTQFAADSLNSETTLQLVEKNYPNIVAVVVWCQSVALDNQGGAAAVMNDPEIITLSDLPSGL